MEALTHIEWEEIDADAITHQNEEWDEIHTESNMDKDDTEYINCDFDDTYSNGEFFMKENQKEKYQCDLLIWKHYCTNCEKNGNACMECAYLLRANPFACYDCRQTKDNFVCDLCHFKLCMKFNTYSSKIIENMRKFSSK